MKVILRADYENLGMVGDVVQVKPGFARNFLIPRKIAYPARSNFVKMIEEEQRQKEHQKNKEKKVAEGLAESLENVSVTISVSVGEEDKMFGSVTTQDIGEALAKQDIEIDRKKIVLEEPIKELGIYSVPIKLHAEVEAKIKVWVVKE
jgi:large subunit ribosomal protein L9